MFPMGGISGVWEGKNLVHYVEALMTQTDYNQTIIQSDNGPLLVDE